jgi:SnoaL-like domain
LCFDAAPNNRVGREKPDLTVDRREILMGMYRAYNERDIDRATEFLAPEVDWPNEATGGHVHGRSAVRQYWQNQWKQTNPRIEPLEVDVDSSGNARVRVHQFVTSLAGAILEDRKLEHLYTFDGAFVAKMTVVDADPEDEDDEDDLDS